MPENHAWMRGQLTSEDICDWLAPQNGWSTDELMHHLEQSCRVASFADPAIPELVAELRRRGHWVVIATDNMDTFTRWTVPSMGLDQMFDAILNSFDLGVLKHDLGQNPTPGVGFSEDDEWPAFMRQQNLTFSDCVLIDDSKKLGAVAAQFNLPYRLVSSQRSLVDHLRDL